MSELESQFVQWKPPQSAEAVKELMANVTADLPQEDGSTELSGLRAKGTVTLLAEPLSRPVLSRWPAGPCYIAGRMRKVAEFNFPAFFAAEAKLTAEGAEVGLNPARYDTEVLGFRWQGLTGFEDLSAMGFDLRKALAKDMEFITGSAAWLCVLPEWEKSTGANAEVATAKALGLPVVEFATGLPIDAPRVFEAGQLCSQASAIVGGARRQAYGSAEMNFDRIADMWESWARVQASAGNRVSRTADVAARMILMKLARIAETPDHTDSWRDIAGYSDCGARCAGCDPAK